jgi:hypothetical protein
MKRIVILTAFITAIALTTATAGSGSQEKETRNLSGFTRVSFGVAGDLYITLGSEFKVVLEGDRDVIRDIETEVTNDKLVIRKDNWHFNSGEKVTVYVTMPAIKGLGVSGSGKAEIKDAVKTEKLDLSVSGSGKLYVNELSVNEVNSSISGSGDIFVTGSGDASKADIAISGSGNYSGEALKIKSAEVSISGSGNCTCNVTESLKASVSGSGNVTYTGNPKIDARVSGSGKVRSR